MPLLVCALLIALLPESIGFLLASGAPAARISAALSRILPPGTLPPNAHYAPPEIRAKGVPVGKLFQSGRAIGTALLWIGFFSAFMVLVTHTAWTPILLRGEGMDIATIALTMAAFNFGSVIGSGAAGWLVVRLGAMAVLPITFLLAGVSIAAIGYAAPGHGAVLTAQVALGLTLGCASSGLIALAAIYYPTAIRSTGVGWSMGMGRFGSFVGPLAVGALVAAKWGVAGVFTAIGLSLLLGAAAVVVIGLRERAP